jgi:hypothetical protein
MPSRGNDQQVCDTLAARGVLNYHINAAISVTL